MTFPRFIRTSQPKIAGASLDYNNPFTAGIVDAVIAADLRTVKGVVATTTGNMSSSVGVLGRKRVSVETGVNKDAYDGAWSRLPAPLTLLTVYKLNTTAYSTRISGNLSASNYGYGLAPNTSNFRAIVSRSGVNTILTGSAVSTNHKTDVLVIDATNAALWENGKRTVAPTAHGGMTTATGSFSLGMTNETGNTDNADYYLAILWNRTLSDAEIKAISDNPWQIFQPVSRAIWMPSPPAAAGSEVSGALTTDNSTVSASASVSPIASASVTTADSTFAGSAGSPSEVSGTLTTDASTVVASASVSPVATASVTTADSTVTSSATATPLVSGSLTAEDATVTGSASVGSIAIGSITTAESTVSSSAQVSPLTSGSLTAEDATVTGSASSDSSVASMSITTEDAFTTAVASVSPSALMAVYTDDAVVSGSAQGQVTGVYPDPATVLAGVVYGPTGADYTGTLAWTSAADIATEVLLRLQATTIPVNLTQVRGQIIGGSGTANDPWGP